MSRPYQRDSWSSQTYVLLAMSTTRGIQAESLLKRSGSCSAPANDGAWAVPAPTPQRTSRSWSARSSSARIPSVRSISPISRSSASPSSPRQRSRM